MVRIINYKKSIKEDGRESISLKVQGGIEAVQSQQSGKLYLTARTAYVFCTFDEQTAKNLIGTELPGEVQKVPCEPYDYVVKDTGETMTLCHRFEYVQEEPAMPAALPREMDIKEEFNPLDFAVH